MRAIIVYSGGARSMEAIVQAISSRIKDTGHSLDQVNVERSARITSLYSYDLVYMGSPVFGFLGGKISPKLASYIRNCSGLQGKKVAVFCTPRLVGVSRALRRMMQLLETKGSIVIDFRKISSRSKAEDYGDKLSRISRA